MRRLVVGSIAASATVLLLLAGIFHAGAVAPGNQYFQRSWARTDQPVSTGQVSRTWMWGPDAFTNELQEPYSESPNGQRSVQYFDKARMEITQPTDGDPGSIWYVTNGLLVVELISGKMQLGDATFSQRTPAAVNVAGDADDTSGPTYASFKAVLNAQPLPVGTPGTPYAIPQSINRNGTVTEASHWADYAIKTAYLDEITNHTIAAPFWSFMNSSGLVWDGTAYVEALLFENPYFATGRPITEAYWANVKVAGSYQDVLMQCFERRCLTYNPANAPEWRVEAGNVGRHYYAWRYTQPGEGATPTATAIPAGTETATSTSSATTSPTASGSPDTASIYEPVAVWGERTDLISSFGAIGLAIGSQGDLWVADVFAERILKFDAEGVFLRSFDSSNSGVGEFLDAADLALDADGNIYVVDSFHNIVQKFAPNGAYIQEWGVLGTGNGQFTSPQCVAVRDNLVYVCDTLNNRIQRFTLAGVYVDQWGALGTGAGQFSWPERIAFDTAGNIYVADFRNDRIQKFDVNGAFISQFGSLDPGPGKLDRAQAVAVANDGVVYAVSYNDTRIVRFAPDGSFLSAWASDGSLARQFREPADLKIGGDGQIYVADAYYGNILVFSSVGEFLFAVNDTGYGRFANPVDLSLDQAENVVIADGFVDFPRIVTYLKNGTQIDSAYYYVPETIERLKFPTSVVTSFSGDRYITDSLNNRVIRIDPAGVYKQFWGTLGTGPGQFNNPQGVAMDADGNIYVVDSGNNRVQKFDVNGVFLGVWGGFGTGDGQFNNPSDVYVAGNRIYVTDTGNDRLQSFDRSGNYLGQWGSHGGEEGQFDSPVGVAVDVEGYVYVVDRDNGRIEKFDQTGGLIATWGSPGGSSGQLDKPWGIAVDSNGYVYVTEQGSYRVQVFRPAP
jgi:sugar lactone lactonase YvrE